MKYPNVSPREFCRLLCQWGFIPQGFKGGHAFYLSPDGKRKIATTSAGRSTYVPIDAVKQAAAVVGVDWHDLLKGPKKQKGRA